MTTGDGSSNKINGENPLIEQFYPIWRNGNPMTTRSTLLIILWFVFGLKSYPKTTKFYQYSKSWITGLGIIGFDQNFSAGWLLPTSDWTTWLLMIEKTVKSNHRFAGLTLVVTLNVCTLNVRLDTRKELECRAATCMLESRSRINIHAYLVSRDSSPSVPESKWMDWSGKYNLGSSCMIQFLQSVWRLGIEML